MNAQSETTLDAVSLRDLNGHHATPPRPEARNVPHRTAANGRERTRQIQELLERVEALPDEQAGKLLHECLQSLLAFYGDGLERILQLTKNAGTDGQKVLEAFTQDNLVRSLLLIHDLHPLSLEARLRESLDKVRPYLESHGGNVELVSLCDEVARLRLHGTCKSCPSSSVTLELAVRQAIEEACPDLLDFEVEGLAPSSAATIPHGPNAPQWTVIENFAPISAGHMRSLQVDGAPVMVCNLSGNLYAYLNRCATCGTALDTGLLTGNVLSCSSGHRFDVQHAGVSLDEPATHLEPCPLLAVKGAVKIAVKPGSPSPHNGTAK